MGDNTTIWTGKAPRMVWADARNWGDGIPFAGVNAVFDDGGNWSVNLVAIPQMPVQIAGTLVVNGDDLTFTGGELELMPAPPNGPQPSYDMQLGNGAIVTVDRDARLSGQQTGDIGATGGATLVVHGSVTEEYAIVYGTLTVSGIGALWRNGESGVDIAGNGRLTVAGGGLMQSSNPSGSLDVDGLGASALVTGKGSVVREPLLFVGEFGGGGVMTIANGATVFDINGNVGGSGEGSIVVSGSGSEWINRGGISIGGQVPGTAQLSILNGAHVSFGKYGLSLDGRLAIDGSSSLAGREIVSGGGVIEAEPGGPATVTLSQDILINYNINNPYQSETTYVGAAANGTLMLSGHITAGFSGQPEILEATTGTVILSHPGNSYDATDIYAADLVIAADHAAGLGALDFIGGSKTAATLSIDPGTAFANVIEGFGASDLIDAVGIHFDAGFSARSISPGRCAWPISASRPIRMAAP
jgi:T5SS/PEP-CTERM-associated repeat protein